MATISKSKNGERAFSFPLALLAIPLFFLGCDEVASVASRMTKTSFHRKFNWKADAFFEDQKVIDLCNAIESDDLDQMRRLIADGADVNAIGKDAMTPLMWSFPDGKLDRFKLMLEAGADPNVKFTGNFGVPSAFLAGDSVTILAAKTYYPGYFEAVMQHGGDPHQKAHDNNPLLHVLIASGGANQKKKIKLLLDAGADVNEPDHTGWTAPMSAVGWYQQYNLALELLEAGADPTIYRENSNDKLIHDVVADKNSLQTLSPQQRLDHARLLEWLVTHGEDAVQAQKDLDRWASWPSIPSLVANRRQAELEARLRREQARKEKAKKEQSKRDAENNKE